MANILLRDRRVTNVTSFIGTSSPRFHTVYAPNMPSPNFGQLLVNTASNEATRELVYEYGDKYSDYFPDAHVSMRILALQPSKSGIELRISSDSIKDIRETESKIMDILKDTKHISWIHDDWDQKRQSIYVDLDRDKANRMGYSRTYLATSVMVGLDGLPLTTIWEDDYPVEVRLTQEKGSEKNINVLEDQYITSPLSFKAIPLRSVAGFTPQWSEGTITHRNGTRTLTLQVDNDRYTLSSSIFNEITPKIEALQLPEGTSISYGGDYEGQKEVFTPMTIALVLSVFIIFFILLFQFKKIKLTILIMSTMLLVLPGAAIGLKLMGYPFSLTAFLGITSLCGLVVRNGIIMIDYLVKLRKEHRMSVYESALAAGKRRMRPIFLTSAAAAVGVIPMILSRSLLWGPLGTVICFGLILGMVLTLYVLPVLYWLMFRGEDRSSQFAVRSSQPAVGGQRSEVSSQPSAVSGQQSDNAGIKPVIATIVLLVGLSVPTFAQNVLSLDSCKKITLEHNMQIKNSQIEIEASRRVEQAAFTKYFPNISAIGLGVQFGDPLLKIDMPGGNLPVYNGDPATLPFATEFAYFPGVSIGMMKHLYTGAITAMQPIFTGGRIINGNQLARLGSNVSVQKLTMSTSEALFRTEELYWQIISLQQKLNTIDAYQHLLDTLYWDVNNAWQAGLINYNDVLKVSLKQSELKMNRLKLENGIHLSNMSLCQHLGITYDPSLALVDSSATYSEPSLLYTDPQQALTNRAEYNLVQQNIEAERLQSKMKLGEYLPQVGVGVGAFTYDMADDWQNNGMVFGTVSIPLTDWWGGSYSLREHKLKEEIAQNNADYTAQLLKLQIEKAWTDLVESWQQIKIAEETVGQAKENLKITRDNYQAGTIGISDLLEAQALYQNTCDNLTEARCNYKIRMAEYRRVIGR